jgi:hypothetical protein
MKEPRNALNKHISTIFQGTDMPEEIASGGTIKPMISPIHRGDNAINQKEEVPDVPKTKPIYPVKDHDIEILMRTVKCSKDHTCYRSGYNILCKAKSLLNGHLVECLERDKPCTFRFTFICRCAIRQYIARKYGK